MRTTRSQNGFALIGVLMLMALLLTVLGGYYVLTRMELSTTKSSMDSFRGFYAAEAGLNVRAIQVRDTFIGYNRPAGSSPDTTGGVAPCAGTNRGSGDFACTDHDFEGRLVSTYLEEAPTNPTTIVIPRGEPFQNLNAQEYRYTTFATASNRDDFPEAVLELHFKSRLVPMFQFAAFYNKDLEILPGPTMTLAGPVHTNGDLYLGCGASGGLNLLGQVTMVGDLFSGRKNSDTCMPGPLSVIDPENLLALPACSGGRRQYTEAELTPWNGMIRTGFDVLTVPEPEALDPTPGEIYWDKADIRVVLDLNGTPAVSIYQADGNIDSVATAALTACGVAAHTSSFYNNREAATIDMLDVDARGLLDCIHTNGLLDAGKTLDDNTEGGLVWYLGVLGPDQDVVNNYGVRVSNGAELVSSEIGAPAIRGLTVVTNQAVYIAGNYNSTNKKPASFLGDSLNILSEGWGTTWGDAQSASSLSSRPASATTINAAFLSGTDTTGGIEGTAGQDLGIYNGGLENYPRFHENWGGVRLTLRGSFVSLNLPRHVDGAWVYGSPFYTAPVRDWGYDTDFDDASKLPPLSPRFVYLRQELFVRQFEL